MIQRSEASKLVAQINFGCNRTWICVHDMVVRVIRIGCNCNGEYVIRSSNDRSFPGVGQRQKYDARYGVSISYAVCDLDIMNNNTKSVNILIALLVTVMRIGFEYSQPPRYWPAE